MPFSEASQRDVEKFAMILDKLYAAAEDKVGRESTSRKELEAGRSLREVYDQYGVL